VPQGRRCECGNRGCWEQYASGNVLVREARELAASGSPMAHALLERVDGDATLLTGPLVTEVARAGDPAAIELFEEVGHWLGVGIANLAAALDPGTFVVGGGVSEAGVLLLGPARESFQRTLTGRRYRPEADIVQAALGNQAGLVGAADLARPFARRFRRARARAADRRERRYGSRYQ
jgi:glucokinase